MHKIQYSQAGEQTKLACDAFGIAFRIASAMPGVWKANGCRTTIMLTANANISKACIQAIINEELNPDTVKLV